MASTAIERLAITAALKERQRSGMENMPLCPYDFAMAKGVAVRFLAVDSMEGIYHRQSGTIVISSRRPRGRKAFTCAHEYGHHVFGHASHVDELMEDRTGRPSDEELLADRFAGFLLMPRTLILQGFRDSGVEPKACTPQQAYAMSCWIGVSYRGFLTHASLAVNVMPLPVADRLKKVGPKEIRTNLVAQSADTDLLIVNEAWQRPVDLVVGDYVLLPTGALADDGVVELVDEGAQGACFRAVSRGIGRVRRGSWAANVRVMPDDYTGLARCRHLPESNDD